MKWILEDALPLVRYVGSVTSKVGWYANIGGGVLHRGHSDHDLDLVFVPRHMAELASLHDALRSIGWAMHKTAEGMRVGWAQPDAKHVERWQTPDGRNVDVIVLRTVNS